MKTRIKSMLTAALVSATMTLPAKADVMLGAYLPGDGWDPSQITNFNNQSTKSISYLNIFSAFSHSWDHLYWQSSNAFNNGSIPLISWMPIDLSRPNENILSEIALGQWDAYIDLWGTKLVDWVNSYAAENQPIAMVRFGHEFNGNWYPYGDSPAWFVSAWQHIHDRFETAGVNEYIEWVWSANNYNVDSYNDMTLYYPGDAYVDWTSLDGYNWGSNYTWTNWDNFNQVFSYGYNILTTNYPSKPILLAEVGSTNPSDQPDPNWGQYGDDSDYAQDKDAWFTDMLTQLETNYPAVRALTLFNINKELGWSLTEWNSSGLPGYNGGTNSTHFTEEFLSASGYSGGAPQSDLESSLDVELDTNPAMQSIASVSNTEAGTKLVWAREVKQEVAASAVFQLDNNGRIVKMDSRKNNKDDKSNGAAAKPSVPNKKKTAELRVTNTLTVRRKIDTQMQVIKAQSKRAPIADVQKMNEQRQGFKNLSTQQLQKLKAAKFGVIDY